MGSLTTRKSSKRKKTTSETDVTKGDKVHFRIVGEEFQITEYLNYIPIIPQKDDVVKLTKNNIHSFYNYRTRRTHESMKNWFLDVDTIDSCDLKEHNLRRYSGDPNEKDNIWVGKSLFKPTLEDFKKYHFSQLHSVQTNRFTTVFSESDTHYRLTKFIMTKTKLCGYKYDKMTRIIFGVSLNKKTGDFYIRKAVFSRRKWRTTLTRNNFHKLFERTFNDYFSFDNAANGIHELGKDIDSEINERVNFHDPDLKDKHIERFVNILGVDLIPFYYKPKPFPRGRKHSEIPSGSEVMIMTVILWFLKKKGIKYPNNPFLILKQHYPKIKTIRKNGMNLAKSALACFGMKTGYMVKFVNQSDDFCLFTACVWYHLLGNHYFSQINFKLIGQSNIFGMFEVLEGLGIVADPSKHTLLLLINNKTLWERISNVLTQEEKYQTLKMLKDPSNDGNIDLSLRTFTDHIKFIRKLSTEYDYQFKIRAKNLEEFETEHNEVSQMIRKFEIDKVIKYNYLEPFVDKVESLIPYSSGENFYPVLLKDTFEYETESDIQKHCVRGYTNNFASIIISIRKNKVDSDDRVTCEFKYNEENNKFVCVQKRAKCNATPDQVFETAFKELEQRLIGFLSQFRYVRPTVISYNKHNDTETVLYDPKLIEDKKHVKTPYYEDVLDFEEI